MSTFEPQLEPGWKQALAGFFQTPTAESLRERLVAAARAQQPVHPPPKNWFAAFNHTPFEQVRVVILGQDPYPTPGHANGLCFSVAPEVKPLPKSLQNIFKELRDDLEIANQHGDLTHWAEQGVLLLNTTLTVKSGQPGSHQGWGWEQLTDLAVQQLAKRPGPLVFLLWGSKAQKKAVHIHRPEHLLLKAPHPSPLSAYRGFFGSRPFSKINQFLSDHGQPGIDWRT